MTLGCRAQQSALFTMNVCWNLLNKPVTQLYYKFLEHLKLSQFFLKSDVNSSVSTVKNLKVTFFTFVCRLKVEYFSHLFVDLKIELSINAQANNCKLVRPNYWYPALRAEVNCHVIIKKRNILIPELVKPEYYKGLGPEIYDMQTPHGTCRTSG